MPIEHRLEHTSRIAVLRYQGTYSAEDWTQAIEAIVADPRFDATYNFLSDRRAATPTLAFAEHVRHYLAARPDVFRGRRVAFVVDSVVGYGMARMQEMMDEGEGVQAQVFTDEAAARQWLAEGRSSSAPA